MRAVGTGFLCPNKKEKTIAPFGRPGFDRDILCYAIPFSLQCFQMKPHSDPQFNMAHCDAWKGFKKSNYCMTHGACKR